MMNKIALLALLVGPGLLARPVYGQPEDSEDSPPEGEMPDDGTTPSPGGPPSGDTGDTGDTEEESGGPGGEDEACDMCGADASYSEEILDQVRAISAGGCPNHYALCTGKGIGVCGDIGEEGTDTEAVPQDRYWEIPAYPIFNAGELTDLTYTLGTVALALNGVSIYSGAISTSAVLDVDDETAEWTSFDMCGGHAESTGDYHYHFPPPCLNAQAEELNPTADGHSPQLGWSYDGFPVYGPLYTGGVQLTGADLDSCGGRQEEMPGLDNFLYRYYLTGATSDLYTLPGDPKPAAEDYPFTIACYVGCTYEEIVAGTCSGDSGVTDSYEPQAVTGYTEEFTAYGEGTSSRECFSDASGATPSPVPTVECVVCGDARRSLMFGNVPCCEDV